MKKNNEFFRYCIGIILVLVIIILLRNIKFLFVPLLNILSIVFSPILVSILFYYILRPLVYFLERKKIKKTFAILIVFLCTILFFALIIVYGGVIIKEQFNSLFSDISNLFKITKESSNEIWDRFGQFIPIATVKQNIISFSKDFLKGLGQNTVNVLSSIADIGSKIILIPFILFYLLKDGKNFIRKFLNIIPQKYRNGSRKLLKDVDKTLSMYITGQLIVAMVIGIFMYIGYIIIGMPNSLILAIFSMVTAIIPFIGAFLGILPAVLIALTIDMSMVVKVLIVSIVVQQLEGNFVSPNIIGNRLNIHPLSIILLIIIAISSFGFIGAFIVIPTYAVLKVIIKDIYSICKFKKFSE